MEGNQSIVPLMTINTNLEMIQTTQSFKRDALLLKASAYSQ
jgi:hypothetical protein